MRWGPQSQKGGGVSRYRLLNIKGRTPSARRVQFMPKTDSKGQICGEAFTSLDLQTFRDRSIAPALAPYPPRQSCSYLPGPPLSSFEVWPSGGSLDPSSHHQHHLDCHFTVIIFFSSSSVFFSSSSLSLLSTSSHSVCFSLRMRFWCGHGEMLVWPCVVSFAFRMVRRNSPCPAPSPDGKICIAHVGRRGGACITRGVGMKLHN